MESFLLKVERFFAAVAAFIVFMTKNLLITAAFVGALLLTFPNSVLSLVDSLRPIQTDEMHKATHKLLGVNQGPRKPQQKAEAGSDLAEIGFDTNGVAIVEEKKDYAALNTMNERRVASLESEVEHLRTELRALKVKYQYGGVEPTTEPTKPKWSWKTMLGITPVEQQGTAK